MSSTDTTLIVIAIIGLILSIVLATFFSYIPMAMIQQRFNKTADAVDSALVDVETVAKDLRISTLQTIDTLNRLAKLENAICAGDLAHHFPGFCD